MCIRDSTKEGLNFLHQSNFNTRFLYLYCFSSIPETDSRSFPPSDNLDTDADQTGDSIVDTPNEFDHHESQYRFQRSPEYQPRYNQEHQLQDQYQRQSDVRAELHNYNRGHEADTRHSRDTRDTRETRLSPYHKPYDNNKTGRDNERSEYRGRDDDIHPPSRRGQGLIYQQSEDHMAGQVVDDDPDHPHYHQL